MCPCGQCGPARCQAACESGSHSAVTDDATRRLRQVVTLLQKVAAPSAHPKDLTKQLYSATVSIPGHGAVCCRSVAAIPTLAVRVKRPTSEILFVRWSLAFYLKVSCSKPDSYIRFSNTCVAYAIQPTPTHSDTHTQHARTHSDTHTLTHSDTHTHTDTHTQYVHLCRRALL